MDLLPMDGVRFAPESSETRALRGAAEAWQEDQVERGGRALGACRTALPVLRGALTDAAVPARWRKRLEDCAAVMEHALTGRP